MNPGHQGCGTGLPGLLTRTRGCPPVPACGRGQVVAARAKTAYPVTRKSRITYTGTGYRDGHDQGSGADIGGARLNQQPRGSLP
jgi:hypothetical protein